jgi:hypothetical protein
MTERPLAEPDAIALIRELRAFCAKLAQQWGASDIELRALLRQLADPHLPVPRGDYSFRVEQWDKSGEHLQWLVAVSDNLLVARAAFEEAARRHPREHWLLRDGIRVVERYEPAGPAGSEL